MCSKSKISTLSPGNESIIWCIFSFFPLAENPACRSVNNCLHITVCLYVVPSRRILSIGTMFLREKWQIASLSCQEVINIWKQTWWSNDKTIIEFSCLKILWFVSISQITDLLATDKLQYFAQPRPIIIVKYLSDLCSKKNWDYLEPHHIDYPGSLHQGKNISRTGN